MNKVKFTTTINRELLDNIKIQAIREKSSVSAIIEKLLQEYLNNISKRE